MDWFLGLFLVPFGGALACRLACRYWIWWPTWLVGASAVFMLVNIFSQLETREVVVGVVMASVLGFVAPDLWAALQVFLRRPRNAAIFIVLLIIVFASLQPGRLEWLLSETMGYVVVISLLLIGLRLMTRGFKGGKKK